MCILISRHRTQATAQNEQNESEEGLGYKRMKQLVKINGKQAITGSRKATVMERFKKRKCHTKWNPGRKGSENETEEAAYEY